MTYPNVESDCSTVRVEDQWMNLNSESCNVFLFEFSGHVALHERCLSGSAVSDQDALESWDITFGSHGSKFRSFLKERMTSCNINFSIFWNGFGELGAWVPFTWRKERFSRLCAIIRREKVTKRNHKPSILNASNISPIDPPNIASSWLVSRVKGWGLLNCRLGVRTGEVQRKIDRVF